MNHDLEYDIALLKQQISKNDNDLKKVEYFKFHLTNWAYHLSTGEFTTMDIDREFDIKSKDEKRTRSIAIKSLLLDGTIQTSGKRHGNYRLVDSGLKPMDFVNATGEPFDLWLPFNIHDKVKVFPGNIIQINGEKNSGKTAFVLNIVKGNMNKHRVVYFNSEMGAQELNLRLSLDNTLSLQSWNFVAYERSSDFSDVIVPGEGNINIIDFLEIHDEFYKMGEYMRNIHDALKGAIAIVCIQKNKGQEFGLGGGRTEEKPRLILNLMPGKVMIKMAKNWVGLENPNGKQVDFKLVNGIKFMQQADWYKEIKA